MSPVTTRAEEAREQADIALDRAEGFASEGASHVAGAIAMAARAIVMELRAASLDPRDRSA